MKASVIKFRRRAKATGHADLPPGQRATITVLPTIRIERFGEPSTVDLPFLPPPKRERRGVASRRARASLEKHAMTLESCLTWLAAISKANPDPRSVEALIDEHFEEFFDGDVAGVLEWLARFAEVWERRMIRKIKPRLV